MRIIYIMLMLINMGICTAQPYINKYIIYDVFTGVSPSSILINNNGYLIADYGFTQQTAGNIAYRTGIIFYQTNFYGDILWQNDYGQPGKQFSTGQYGSFQKVEGGYLVGGSVVDTISQEWDYYLAKFDTFGNKIWLKTYRRGGLQNCWHGQATPDGGYIMAGEEIRNGDRNYYVLKADSNGNKQWDAVYGGGLDDIALNVRPLVNGNYIISGRSESYGPALSDLWFFETDSIGNILWQKTFGTPGDDRFRYITLSKDGGYIGWGTLDTVIYNTEAQYAASVMKFDENRKIQWRTFFRHEKRRIIWQLRELDDGNIVAIGEQRVGGVDSIAGWIAKLNAKGDILWERFFMNEFFLTDSLFSRSSKFKGDFQQTPDGGFVIAGTIFHATVSNPNLRFANIWLVKLDSNGCLGPNNCGLNVGIAEPGKDPYDFQAVAWPNPASQYANLYIKGNSSRWAGKQIQISLYSLTGRQLHTQTRQLNYAGYTETKLNTSNLPAGVYIYEIKGDGDVLGSGKLVVQ